MPALWTLLLAGFLGSAHCAGMCGGFALALGALPGSRAYAGRLAAYLVGKTATYAVLGALAGAFGLVLFRVTAVQRGMSMGLGLGLVALGVSLVRGQDALGGRWAAPLVRPLTRLVGRGTLGAAFGLGALNGLLPCGLVAAFLVQAALTGTPAQGALVLAVLGVATAPALVLTGTLGRLVRPVLRQRLQVVGGMFVLLVGMITIARATPLMHLVMKHAPGVHQSALQGVGPSCMTPH